MPQCASQCLKHCLKRTGFHFDVWLLVLTELLCIAVLLILASQRIEVLIAEWFDNEELKAWLSQDVTVKRGATPTMVEWAILSWVAGNPFSSTFTMPPKPTKKLHTHCYISITEQ